MKVRRILRCSRCGRVRFVQPEAGIATCKECLATEAKSKK